MGGMTHYLPSFTELQGVRQKAVCGIWIAPSEHSTTPLCEQCLDYLTAESKTATAIEHTHYVMFGTPSYRGMAVSVCGINVRPNRQSTEATCPECLDWLTADAADLRALQDMQPDPALLVQHKPFNPIAGYKTRNIR
ncbi:MAG: hypothetical protein ABI665_09385 [Vicinamibacterales bacterium]